MGEIITYSLRDGHERSDQYYRDVAGFADEVVAEAGRTSRLVVEAFQTFVGRTQREQVRTFPEYAFELLTMGVLWRTYVGDALGLAEPPRRVLTGLVRLRERGGFLKPAAGFLRHVLAVPFLPRGGGRRSGRPLPTLDSLDRLLNWLTAAGDFTQEVERLRVWRDFLVAQPAEQVSASLAAAVSFAAWFETSSEAALGRYTPNVERFLAETRASYRFREDAVFCGRRRVEYHLNMVGTEILNGAFRESFLQTERKLVLLPPCIRAQPDRLCQARPTPFGARCAGCTPDCRVRQLTELGRALGFATLILPDELSVFSSGAIKPMDDEKTGIVGVSCALTNMSGGWETRALGVPAQGVLLDYCGCSWHWHKKGIPTDVNVGQLLAVLGIDDIESPLRGGDAGQGTGDTAFQPQ